MEHDLFEQNMRTHLKMACTPQNISHQVICDNRKIGNVWAATKAIPMPLSLALALAQNHSTEMIKSQNGCAIK